MLIALAVACMILGSCQNLLEDPGLDGNTNIGIVNGGGGEIAVPYATDDVLDGLTKSDDTYADWRLVRQLALIEFEDDVKHLYNWEGHTLSKKPVVIYGTESMPQYYEFMVLNDKGTPVGTLTTFARKQYFEVVSHVLPFVRNYEPVATKGPDHQEFDLGAYPRTAIGLPGKNGEAPSMLVDADTGEPTDFYEPAIELEAYAEMDDETLLEATGMTRDHLNRELQEKRELEEATETSTEDFWEAMEIYKDNFMALTDMEIKDAYADSKVGYNNLYIDSYIVEGYNEEEAQQTLWGGWCIPSAIAYVYKNSISDYYKGTYLPGKDDLFFNDGNSGGVRSQAGSAGIYYYGGSTDGNWIKSASEISDGGLYYKLMTTPYRKWSLRLFFWTIGPRTTALANGGYVYFSGLDDLMRAATDGKYTILPYNKSSMARRMKSGYPALIAIPNHVVVGIGAQVSTRNWTVRYNYRFLWFKWSKTVRKTSTSYRFLITDNANYVSPNPNVKKKLNANLGNKDYTPFWTSLGAIKAWGPYSLYRY